MKLTPAQINRLRTIATSKKVRTFDEDYNLEEMGLVTIQWTKISRFQNVTFSHITSEGKQAIA